MKISRACTSGSTAWDTTRTSSAFDGSIRKWSGTASASGLASRRCPGLRHGRKQVGTMQPQMLADTIAKPSWLAVHPVSEGDSVAAGALRAGVAGFKGKLAGTAARAPFDEVMG